MKKIKKIWYMLPSDLLISLYTLILIVVSLFVMLVISVTMSIEMFAKTYNSTFLELSDIVFCCLAYYFLFRAVWIIFITPRIGINRKLKIFCVSRSVLHPRRLWIYQRSCVNLDNNACPAKQLVKEKRILLKEIGNKICYANTHDAIKELFEKKGFHFYKCYETHKSSLEKVKNIITKHSKEKEYRCCDCENKGNNICPLYQNETAITTFYNMKIGRKVK